MSTANADVTIEVRDVSKAFRVYSDKSHTFKDRVLFHKRNQHRLHHVLNHFSFEVRRGQALGLIGHNGCGKSTTLKLLNRILYPDSGQILMHGRISSLIELGAGFHPDMSGRENIYINATIFGLKKHEVDRRLEQIIRFSELEEYIDNPVRTYSSGMYMRLAFSVAINVDADILLVDEILAVGDANFQKKCFDKLQEIKASGTTIVIVSHNMDQIKSICDRVLWLDNGEIKGDGEPRTVCEEYMKNMRDYGEERARQEREELKKKDPGNPDVLYPPTDVSGSQCSRYAHRKGDMRARFTMVSVLDGSKCPAQCFRFGQPAYIQFDISKAEGVPGDLKVYIIFNIFGEDGRLCSKFTTLQTMGRYLSFDELKGGAVRIGHMTLADGNYILDAVLADEQETAYDCLLHQIEFYVADSGKFGGGIAAMEHEWI